MPSQPIVEHLLLLGLVTAGELEGRDDGPASDEPDSEVEAEAVDGHDGK